jgi:hypothetical protein
MKGTCNPIDEKTGKAVCGMYELFGEVRKCPNFIESWWKPNPLDGDQTPILVADCAPIRTMILIQELSNRLVGVEKAQEHLRNETVWTEVVAHVIGRNIGVDLTKFVEERQRQIRVMELKKQEEQDKALIEEKSDGVV